MKGDGSIYRRPATRHWWVEYHVAGVRHRESSGTDSKQEARRFLRKRQQDAAEGKKPWMSNKLTVENLLKFVENDYIINGRKLSLNGPFKHLMDAFSGVRLSKINVGRIQEYVRQRMDEGAAPGTINIELAVLRRGFNLAREAGQVAIVPKITALVLNNARKGFFTHEEFVAVLAHLPLELMPLFRTAYITGWRIGELLSRQKRHVDLDAGFLRLEPGETKNGEGRMFPLTPELRAILARQLERTHTLEVEQDRIIPWLFHRNGWQIRSCKKAWHAATKAAGLSGKLIHDLRRTAVRNLERAGVSRSAAMQMVGHKTEVMYRRYAIVDETMLREAAVKLSQLRHS